MASNDQREFSKCGSTTRAGPRLQQGARSRCRNRRLVLPGRERQCAVCSTDLRRAPGDQGRKRAFAFTLDRPAVPTPTRVPDRGDSFDTVLYLLRGCGGNDEIACRVADIGRDNKLSRLSEVELSGDDTTSLTSSMKRAPSLVAELSDRKSLAQKWR